MLHCIAWSLHFDITLIIIGDLSIAIDDIIFFDDTHIVYVWLMPLIPIISSCYESLVAITLRANKQDLTLLLT